MADPSHEPLGTGYAAPLQSLITGALKFWTAIVSGVVWIGQFGVYVMIVRPLVSHESQKRKDTSAPHADDSSPAAKQHSWIITKFLEIPFSRPKSFWVPLYSITLTVFYAFHALKDHHTAFDNTTEFAIACPENDRRTQTSALVKLFAATVTTVCIHGHRGSLTGSCSWRRELFRMLEVLVNPLASLFAATDIVWREIASQMQTAQNPWGEELGIRYRLACMCRVQIDNGPKMGPALLLTSINPCHISSKSLDKDLKWLGRLFLLVILFAQYVQAAILLSRRFISNTAATVECAMILMTISGFAALTQSLIISLINTTWTLKSQSFSPCTARTCFLEPCITLKTESELPNSAHKLVAFGCNLNGLPRSVLYMLAGGNLQLLLLSSKKEKWWRVMVTTGSTQMFQIILISLLTSAYYGGNLFRDARNDSLPRNNENTTGTNGTKPQGTPKTTRSFVFTPLGVILYVILWIGGLVSIMVGLLMVVFHLVYLFFPCIMMYLLIWGETRDWKDWDPSKPCPQLWKDGLEDELWWF